MSRGTVVHIRDKAQEMEIQSVVERERLIIFLGRAWRIARVSWAEDQRIHAFLMPPGLHRVPLPYSFIPREKEREREKLGYQTRHRVILGYIDTMHATSPHAAEPSWRIALVLAPAPRGSAKTIFASFGGRSQVKKSTEWKIPWRWIDSSGKNV